MESLFYCPAGFTNLKRTFEICKRGVYWGMFQSHPLFQPLANANFVWRYMDLAKFVHLLDTTSLYFSRAAQFADPYEGHYPKKNMNMKASMNKADPYRGEVEEKFMGLIRACTYINCWHGNNYESAAMWDLYSKQNDGVAIQTDYKGLCHSFGVPEDIKDPAPVFVGKVDYIDYSEDKIKEDNLFYPFLHKRKSFEHEKEVRAIAQRLPKEFIETGRLSSIAPENLNIKGVLVPVDLNTLIHKIYVAPTASKMFVDVVVSVAKRYGIKKPIIQSDLYNSPLR